MKNLFKAQVHAKVWYEGSPSLLALNWIGYTK